MPFANGTFDAVVCQFGVMFFPDKPKSHREAFRVLKAGGHLLFSVWDRIETNDLTHIVHKAPVEMFPDDPPMFMSRTPMGYHDIPRIRADLAGGGFANSTVETRKLPCRTPSARNAALGLIRGTPLGGEITARDPSGLDKAVKAATQAITQRFGPGPIEASMQAHIIAASRSPQ
jgi:SAM-dependent methyltransferase